jgi:hypothetical protein
MQLVYSYNITITLTWHVYSASACEPELSQKEAIIALFSDSKAKLKRGYILLVL